jgi:protein TonB
MDYTKACISLLYQFFFIIKTTTMRSENILKTDLLDLLFENRNKKYGAYELRKNYQKRLMKAVFVGLVFAGGFTAMVLMVKKEKKFIVPDIEVGGIFDMTPPPPPEPPKPKPKTAIVKAPATQTKPAPTQQWTEPVIVDNLPISKLPNNLDDVAIGGTTKRGAPDGPHVLVPDPIITDRNGDPKPVAARPVDRETPLEAAEVMPAYPGGMAALRKFLEKNLNSPEDLEEGNTVTVRVKFIVGYDGKLKGFEILQDGGASFNKEVIRVLKKMPEWIPGRANGENVSVYYTIPVKFTPAL